MLNRTVRLFDLLGDKPFFSTSELAEALEIKKTSANVLAARYAKSGIFIRLKRDLYVLSQAWKNLSISQSFRIANILQVPSYISFMTALSYHEVTTQILRNVFESAAIRRSVTFDIRGTIFNYHKLKREFYFGFTRIGEMFISTKEKAFVDCLYLISLDKYRMDLDSIDTSKLDKKKLSVMLKIYPGRTIKLARSICNI